MSKRTKLAKLPSLRNNFICGPGIVDSGIDNAVLVILLLLLLLLIMIDGDDADTDFVVVPRVAIGLALAIIAFLAFVIAVLRAAEVISTG